MFSPRSVPFQRRRLPRFLLQARQTRLPLQRMPSLAAMQGRSEEGSASWNMMRVYPPRQGAACGAPIRCPPASQILSRIAGASLTCTHQCPRRSSPFVLTLAVRRLRKPRQRRSEWKLASAFCWWRVLWRHADAVAENGELFVFGYGHSGQPGLGDLDCRFQPTLVPRAEFEVFRVQQVLAVVSTRLLRP